MKIFLMRCLGRMGTVESDRGMKIALIFVSQATEFGRDDWNTANKNIAGNYGVKECLNVCG